MINYRSIDPTREQRRSPRSRVRFETRLQSYARYPADDAPTEDMGQIVTVTVHDMSLEGVATNSIRGLRVSSLLRLFLHGVGWRHVEVRWIKNGLTGCRFLLPLLPYEFADALANARRNDDDILPDERAAARLIDGRLLDDHGLLAAIRRLVGTTFLATAPALRAF